MEGEQLSNTTIVLQLMHQLQMIKGLIETLLKNMQCEDFNGNLVT